MPVVCCIMYVHTLEHFLHSLDTDASIPHGPDPHTVTSKGIMIIVCIVTIYCTTQGMHMYSYQPYKYMAGSYMTCKRVNNNLSTCHVVRPACKQSRIKVMHALYVVVMTMINYLFKFSKMQFSLTNHWCIYCRLHGAYM